MKATLRALIQPHTARETVRRFDRRLAVDTSLRRAVLGSGVALSVVCYVLAITAR
ncbi:MAG: hypothetical protein HQ454_03270 [Acidimicrobiaceae bacterium]|nr:hypothetical protein [Acidimicrobiaceae bacterium]